MRSYLSIREKEKVIQFLSQEEYILIKDCLRKMKISHNDKNRHYVEGNIEKSFRVLKLFLRRRSDSLLKRITKKIVTQRIEANVDLSDFLMNIQIGKEIVLERLLLSSLDKDIILRSNIFINQFSDQYIYHVVHQYTKMKDRIILEKSQFIQEMNSDRLSILGKISSSFAHEFRNPLTTVKGFIQLIERKYKSDEQTRPYFNMINTEIESLESNINRFLFLSKMPNVSDKMVYFDLGELVRYSSQFMNPRCVIEKISVKMQIPNKNIIMYGVPEQINQVLLNIMNNAIEALTEIDDHRKIDITLESSNNLATITISNNGKRIPQHLVENIFQPFVSTKELGTGLGLSVCKQIIEKHQGEIYITTNDKETSFSLKMRT
ncbi:ATP-binding protein [Terrilactibacillus laevilacticus]|uniref:histidine kinase n=1 Tax=Terrilactibacillus laevilacticus TaxID=1380157 RepID=A0ABW5PQI4_9BACI|nr:ATP-binding protein [Terrilactibacillus laevilacticus]